MGTGGRRGTSFLTTDAAAAYTATPADFKGSSAAEAKRYEGNG